ncbi:hypothetical protein MYX78_13845 [Acidobacteria bacterium AH-259-G07]|nr:hypothetical protein [Acidobacteria bacterium AH-259-G07]
MRRFWQGMNFESRYGEPLESWARGVLEKAGLARTGADLNELAILPIGAEQPDSQEGYAVRLLEKLECVRTLIRMANLGRGITPDLPEGYAIRHGEAADAALFAFELGAISMEARMKSGWEGPALKGLKFIEGPKQRRLDALGKLILATLARLHKELRRKPTAREVWKSLPIGDVIQERDDDYDELWWRSNGREKKTGFKAFQHRLSTIQKKSKN